MNISTQAAVCINKFQMQVELRSLQNAVFTVCFFVACDLLILTHLILSFLDEFWWSYGRLSQYDSKMAFF